MATFRSEPMTYNRFVSSRTAEDLVMRLTHATLVRLDRVTGKLEPWLATSWTSSSADGRVWTLKLRPGVVFSDGAPFSAADVQFTFQALYDKQVASPLASSVLIADQPLDVRALDDTTIVLTMPAPYGPGLSLLDAIPILPRHKLEAAFKAGTFRDAWGLSTPPSDLAGLGPFMLKTVRARQSACSSSAIRTTGARTTGAPLCRDSMSSKFKSCPTRTPSSCGCKRARLI